MPNLLVIGLSHKTARVEQREKAALTDGSARALMRDIRRDPCVSEVVALSTCNRTEVYARATDAALAEEVICTALVAHSTMTRPELDCARYVRREDRAASHLFRVAGSLDSMVVGESEIQAQVRAAWEVAREESAVGPLLDRMFRQALEAGKRVRSETGVARGAVSVSSVAVDLAGGVLDDLPRRRALLIGAGQMAESTARALVDHGISEVAVVNRTPGAAAALAARFGGRGAGFDRMAAELEAADIVISSTDAPHLILGGEEISRALRTRPERPMLLIDIAVPRDLDPAIAGVNGAVLYDIDDLERVVEANLNGRRLEAERAERLVQEEARRFSHWRQGLVATPAITSLRAHAEEIRSRELERLDGQWESLSRADRERVEELTRSIVNKLLHEPTARARAAAQEGDMLRHVESLRHLFGLEAPSPRG
jgi:glutamyl-tRNA reductase